MADTANTAYDQVKQQWLDATQAGKTGTYVDMVRLDTLLQEYAAQERQLQHLLDTLDRSSLGTVNAEMVLAAYPCASPTCPAEPCILGRRITELDAALTAACELVPLVRKGAGTACQEYSDRMHVIRRVCPTLDRLEAW